MITDSDKATAKKILEFVGSCECAICTMRIAKIIADHRGEAEEARSVLVVCEGAAKCSSKSCHHKEPHKRDNRCACVGCYHVGYPMQCT